MGEISKSVGRAVAKELKTDLTLVGVWGVLLSPIVAGVLLGWLGIVAWLGVVIVALTALVMTIKIRRNLRSHDLELQDQKAYDWWMNKEFADLEPPIRWDWFEDLVVERLADDQWAKVPIESMLRMSTELPCKTCGALDPKVDRFVKLCRNCKADQIELYGSEEVYDIDQIHGGIAESFRIPLHQIGEFTVDNKMPPISGPQYGHRADCKLRGFPSGLNDIYSAVENNVAVAKCRHCDGTINGPQKAMLEPGEMIITTEGKTWTTNELNKAMKHMHKAQRANIIKMLTEMGRVTDASPFPHPKMDQRKR